MSELLIRGMKMPKEDTLMILSPDGTVTFMYHETAIAVEVPPHGRLIDADVMKTKMVCSEYWEKVLIEWIDEQKTVIPAEEGE